jgi:KipI family sensor histidine kinase inhibitor
VRILDASDHSVEVSFGETIAVEHHQKVAGLTRWLLERASDISTGILNIHPAYSSVLVSFDPLRATHAAIQELIRTCAEDLETAPLEGRLIEVPVCYGGEFGPDLEYVARWNGLTCDDVIGIHSSAEYRVFFLGFSPGFPYLGGMPSAIATPRLDAPRKLVPAGSVAIGGSQTGIYPVASAAGWRVIGRTPLRLFRADQNPPTLLWMGDRLRFVPVTREEYERAQPASR